LRVLLRKTLYARLELMKKVLVLSFLISSLILFLTPNPVLSIQTAIGDIDPDNLQSFTRSLLSIAFGVAGGVAFLLMLFGALQIMTSSGDPEKMKSGSELITSALTGLLFIIFSIFLLKLIGVTVLEIPGFGK